MYPVSRYVLTLRSLQYEKGPCPFFMNLARYDTKTGKRLGQFLIIVFSADVVYKVWTLTVPPRRLFRQRHQIGQTVKGIRELGVEVPKTILAVLVILMSILIV